MSPISVSCDGPELCKDPKTFTFISSISFTLVDLMMSLIPPLVLLPPASLMSALPFAGESKRRVDKDILCIQRSHRRKLSFEIATAPGVMFGTMLHNITYTGRCLPTGSSGNHAPVVVIVSATSCLTGPLLGKEPNLTCGLTSFVSFVSTILPCSSLKQRIYTESDEAVSCSSKLRLLVSAARVSEWQVFNRRLSTTVAAKVWKSQESGAQHWQPCSSGCCTCDQGWYKLCCFTLKRISHIPAWWCPSNVTAAVVRVITTVHTDNLVSLPHAAVLVRPICFHHAVHAVSSHHYQLTS